MPLTNVGEVEGSVLIGGRVEMGTIVMALSPEVLGGDAMGSSGSIGVWGSALDFGS